MKILYKPFGIIATHHQGQNRAKPLQDDLVADRRRGPAESATTEDASFPKIVGAAALEAATMAASAPPSTASARGRSTT